MQVFALFLLKDDSVIWFKCVCIKRCFHLQLFISIWRLQAATALCDFYSLLLPIVQQAGGDDNNTLERRLTFSWQQLAIVL